jgi:hypothetical protein
MTRRERLERKIARRQEWAATLETKRENQTWLRARRSRRGYTADCVVLDFTISPKRKDTTQ